MEDRYSRRKLYRHIFEKKQSNIEQIFETPRKPGRPPWSQTRSPRSVRQIGTLYVLLGTACYRTSPVQTYRRVLRKRTYIGRQSLSEACIVVAVVTVYWFSRGGGGCGLVVVAVVGLFALRRPGNFLCPGRYLTLPRAHLKGITFATSQV